jgi:tetratricopeptide (TPR) repeat protein
MRRIIGTILVLACAASPALGDIIEARDGHVVVGKLTHHGAFWVVTGAAGAVTVVADDDVRSIELTTRPPTDPTEAARRLASLRRGVAALDDPARAVDRYQRFIAVGADPATLATARADLALWQDRLDRHLVRLGNGWVAPATREQAMAAAMANVEAARQAVKQGQLPRAEPLLLAALTADPQNASAEYLLGLIRAERGEPAAAGRAFAAADGLVPNHPATLNNLAVVLWQQRQFLPALARYEQAMAAAPDDARVLGNVAAALAGLPPALAPNPAVVRVRAQFQVLDRQMTVVMTGRGLHRFGADWLTDEQMSQVAVLQQRDRQQLDALSADFAKQQDAVRQTDLQIAEAEQQIARTAGTGAIGPYLASYDGYAGRGRTSTVVYELSNDEEQLQQRRAAQVAVLDGLQRQAAALARRIAGQVDGPSVQRLAGPEGTPLRVPSPTTRPTVPLS